MSSASMGIAFVAALLLWALLSFVIVGLLWAHGTREQRMNRRLLEVEDDG